MSSTLCITFRFIQPLPLFHGSGDDGAPEWPPSPMRAFQALVNAASLRYRGQLLPREVESVLTMIESIRPSIIAPNAIPSTIGYRAYVPHNQADLITAAWHRGNVDVSIASHRMEKDIRPMRITHVDEEIPELHYLFPLNAPVEECRHLLNIIRPCVRSISSLGWGIDLVAADATLLIDNSSPNDAGHRWQPAVKGRHRFRVHRKGTLHSLRQRYDRFLSRLIDGKFSPVPPITTVDVVTYARETDSVAHPFAIFKLLDDNEDAFRYPHAKLIHIAGMVRHLAIEAMIKSPPNEIKKLGEEACKAWVDSYVAGHVRKGEAKHQQFSYLPLPSIGHRHTDPSVRRIMIVAPPGDDQFLRYLAQRLNGEQLKPTPQTKLEHPPTLVQVRHDKVASFYTQPANTWYSVTPVILPGYDDRKPEKTCKLIQRALAQSGIEQECEFEWSAFSRFPKLLSAHNYVRNKMPIGYIRPDYLLSQAAVHLQIRFKDGLQIPGPLAIGAGRHCGLGVFAAEIP